MTRFSRTVPALLVLAMLGGCSTWQEGYTDKRNDVSLVRMTHDIAFVSGDARLTAASAADLHRFLADQGVSYGDTVTIDTGATPAALAGQRRAVLATMLAKEGITVAAASAPYGATPRADTARLVIGRYLVTPPQCPDWRKPSDRDYGNTQSSDYGCASATNLGLMVANPHDLIEGRGYAGPDAELAAKAVQQYHADAVKTPTAPSASSGGQ
jgi:pilus assembly protein CpaD